MKKRKLPQGLRKFIRQEKARIRREVLDIKKQKEEIQKLYQEIFKKTVKVKKSLLRQNVKTDQPPTKSKAKKITKTNNNQK
ncbi:hypothetical protein ACFL0A_00300 [Patescibacteria group bacterium]